MTFEKSRQQTTNHVMINDNLENYALGQAERTASQEAEQWLFMEHKNRHRGFFLHRPASMNKGSAEIN